MFYNIFSLLDIKIQILFLILISIIMTILAGRKIIPVLMTYKIGQPIRYQDIPKLNALHQNKKDTPTMGGVIIIAVYFILSIFFLDLNRCSNWLLLFSLLYLGMLGALDDIKKLKGVSALGVTSKIKFLLQLSCGVAILIIFYIMDIQQFNDIFLKNGNTFLFRLFAILFFLFVFTGSSNAVNLTDGLDGLAIGTTLIVAIGLLFSIAIVNDNLLYNDEMKALAILIGSAIGFLWFNQYPASVFMGDTGSLSVGGFLALIAFLTKREWIYAFMGIVFVVEALSVILQVLSYRYRNKKKIFLCTPIHHHFQYKGDHEVKIVTRFWLVTVFFVLATLLFQLSKI